MFRRRTMTAGSVRPSSRGRGHRRIAVRSATVYPTATIRRLNWGTKIRFCRGPYPDPSTGTLTCASLVRATARNRVRKVATTISNPISIFFTINKEAPKPFWDGFSSRSAINGANSTNCSSTRPPIWRSRQEEATDPGICPVSGRPGRWPACPVQTDNRPITAGTLPARLYLNDCLHTRATVRPAYPASHSPSISTSWSIAMAMPITTVSWSNWTGGSSSTSSWWWTCNRNRSIWPSWNGYSGNRRKSHRWDKYMLDRLNKYSPSCYTCIGCWVSASSLEPIDIYKSLTSFLGWFDRYRYWINIWTLYSHFVHQLTVHIVIMRVHSYV